MSKYSFNLFCQLKDRLLRIVIFRRAADLNPSRVRAWSCDFREIQPEAIGGQKLSQ